jgi:alkylation response protein AidB-like acyl-CoA dehydrogenase
VGGDHRLKEPEKALDFTFGEDQDLLRDSTRRFLADRQPLSALRPVLEAPEVVDRAAWREAAELGWTSMLVPAEHDGGSVTDQPLVDLVVLGEELGRVLHPGPFVPTNVVADVVARWGSDAQRKELLGPLARGEQLASWCLSGDGSVESDSCVVQAEQRGDAYVLDGVARYVHGATVADLFLVVARASKGLIHVLVPSDVNGVAVRTQQCLDLTRRFGEVTFDGVEVDAAHLLDHDPAAVLERAIDVATVLQAAEAVGGADRLFGETVAYLKDRVQFGRTIASFQAIKHRIADLLVLLEGMRAATHLAALALDDGFDDRAAAVSTAGSYVDDGFAHLCGEALQLHGGIGFTWEHDAHLFVRRAKTSQALYGESSWHRERLCSLAEADADRKEAV